MLPTPFNGDVKPTYCIASASHRRWMKPLLEQCGWRSGSPSDATFCWQLVKKMLPIAGGAAAFNCLPHVLLLDDKAALALLSHRFTRTRPLATHIVYGEWDEMRIAAICSSWSAPACGEPRWWIVKDAHSSNGFNAALFDRAARPLCKQDVPGGYCYVVQEYVERPLLIDGRKFEMRQYVLLCGDGSAYTYDSALLRLASVAYDLVSTDRRAHITNKFVQTGWEAQNEFLERPSTDWPPYAALLDTAILPLVSDLADAVMPLLVSGLRGQRLTSRAAAASTASAEPSGSAYHFELLACDLMVDVEGGVHLMEVEPRSLRQLSTA